MTAVEDAVGNLPMAPQILLHFLCPKAWSPIVSTFMFIGGLLSECQNLLHQYATVQIKQNQHSISWPLTCKLDEVTLLTLPFTKRNQSTKKNTIPTAGQLSSPTPCLSAPFYTNSPSPWLVLLCYIPCLKDIFPSFFQFPQKCRIWTCISGHCD